MNTVTYVKYLRWETMKGEKAYYALVNWNGRNRVSRRRFRKASAATIYGHQWAERASRLLGVSTETLVMA